MITLDEIINLVLSKIRESDEVPKGEVWFLDKKNIVTGKIVKIDSELAK